MCCIMRSDTLNEKERHDEYLRFNPHVAKNVLLTCKVVKSITNQVILSADHNTQVTEIPIATNIIYQ